MLNHIKPVGAVSFIMLLLGTCMVYPANGGEYLSSAHGDTTNGVERSSMDTSGGLGYQQGNCAHCHEQHMSVEGSEPAPSPSGPNKYALFYSNYVAPVTTQDGVCFQCHDDITAIPTSGGINNYSYSWRAGGWNSGAGSNVPDDIVEAFTLASYHDLDSILTFIQTQAWGYSADSNPCAACHNPHAAQGDPIGTNGLKSTATRGWPLSRPSEHTNSPWDLWGDDYDGTAGAVSSGTRERMYNYSNNYQAPYRVGGTSYEPVGHLTSSGTAVTDAAKSTTDFVTFCLDCHANAIGTTSAIDWSAAGDMHGAATARDGSNNKGTLNAPYNEAAAFDYVLSCMDCHEGHGSTNAYLLRGEVNSTVIGGVITATNLNNNWPVFCGTCHTVTATGGGSACNAGQHGSYATGGNCSGCHFHGSTVCGANGF